MATQIPNTDSMKVASHDVVPGQGATQVVLSGAPHPRAMILELSLPILAALTAQLIRALSVIDRSNLVIGLRQLLKELTGEAGVPAGTAAEPTPDSAQLDALGIEWIAKIARGVQSQGRLLGLSDAAIAALIPVVLRDEVTTVLADQELGRRIADPALASSRAGMLGLTQQPPWTVQIGDGRSLDVDPDLERGEVSVFASTDAGSKQVMMIKPSISYRLGVTLQVASSYVEGHRGSAPESAVVAPPSAPLPVAGPPVSNGGEDPRAR
jgi:hypothetical protein